MTKSWHHFCPEEEASYPLLGTVLYERVSHRKWSPGLLCSSGIVQGWKWTPAPGFQYPLILWWDKDLKANKPSNLNTLTAASGRLRTSRGFPAYLVEGGHKLEVQKWKVCQGSTAQSFVCRMQEVEILLSLPGTLSSQGFIIESVIVLSGFVTSQPLMWCSLQNPKCPTRRI